MQPAARTCTAHWGLGLNVRWFCGAARSVLCSGAEPVSELGQSRRGEVPRTLVPSSRCWAWGLSAFQDLGVVGVRTPARDPPANGGRGAGRPQPQSWRWEGPQAVLGRTDIWWTRPSWEPFPSSSWGRGDRRLHSVQCCSQACKCEGQGVWPVTPGGSAGEGDPRLDCGVDQEVEVLGRGNGVGWPGEGWPGVGWPGVGKGFAGA